MADFEYLGAAREGSEVIVFVGASGESAHQVRMTKRQALSAIKALTDALIDMDEGSEALGWLTAPPLP